MESNTTLYNTESVYKQIVKEILDKYITRNTDMMTVRSLKIEIVNQILNDLNLPLEMLFKLFKTHTVIHDEYMDKLLKKADEDTRTVLAQKFVKNEKLVRILKEMVKDNFSDIEIYLAVDGLYGNLSNGPNFDYKHYLSNMIIPSDVNAPVHQFDNNSEHKRRHVHGIRAMYKVLKDNGMNMDPFNVYLVMSKVIYDTTQLDLPKVKDDFERLSDAMYKTMEEAYLSIMDPKNIQTLVKSLRYRGEKRHSINSEDECGNGSHCKQRSVEREVET